MEPPPSLKLDQVVSAPPSLPTVDQVNRFITDLLGISPSSLLAAASLPAKAAGLAGVYALAPPVIFGVYQLLKETGPYRKDNEEDFVEFCTVSLSLFWVVASPFLIPPMVSSALPFPLSNSIVLALLVGSASMVYVHFVGTTVTSKNASQAFSRTTRWWRYLARLAAWPPKVFLQLGKATLVKTLRTIVELFMGFVEFVFRQLGLEEIWNIIVRPLLEIARKAMEFIFSTIGPGVEAIKGVLDMVADALGSLTGGGGGVLGAAGGALGAVGGAVSSGVSAIGGALGISDVRLKTAITRVGEFKPGVGIYEWQWTKEALEMGAEPERTRGVLAQEVLAVDPDRVHTNSRGYLMIDGDYYNELD